MYQSDHASAIAAAAEAAAVHAVHAADKFVQFDQDVTARLVIGN